MAAAHKFPKPMPPELLALLGSDESSKAVQRKLMHQHGIEVTADAVRQQRVNLFPGRSWPMGRPTGVKNCGARRKSKALLRLSAFCAEVRRHNLLAIECINAARQLRDPSLKPFNPYDCGDLW